MTLSWRLEVEFASIYCDIRVSSRLPLLFLNSVTFFYNLD